MNILRHGDLLIRKINKLPDNLKEVKSDVLWNGETGHKHRLHDGDFTIYENAEKLRWIFIASDTKLSHEEHKTLTIKPATYEVIIEQEYDYFDEETKQVQD